MGLVWKFRVSTPPNPPNKKQGGALKKRCVVTGVPKGRETSTGPVQQNLASAANSRRFFSREGSVSKSSHEICEKHMDVCVCVFAGIAFLEWFQRENTRNIKFWSWVPQSETHRDRLNGYLVHNDPGLAKRC